ncbi:MAG: DUF6265 family protein [Bacteroidota bacterium]
MKKATIYFSLIAITILSLSACKNISDKKNEAQKNETPILTENFDWLLGKWQRTNEEEGKETFENWDKKSEIEYNGIGFTIQNNDTVKQEKIKIIRKGEKWNLEVISPGETDWTKFEITSLEKDKFTCENPELEFPNKIKYWKEGNKIKASVSGKDLEIPFEFKKVKP